MLLQKATGKILFWVYYLYYNAYYLIHYDDTSYEDEWVLQDQVGVIVG